MTSHRYIPREPDLDDPRRIMVQVHFLRGRSRRMLLVPMGRDMMIYDLLEKIAAQLDEDNSSLFLKFGELGEDRFLGGGEYLYELTHAGQKHVEMDLEIINDESDSDDEFDLLNLHARL
ncbi:uncharacterized protein EHS24_006978 [Apiotrichum porosum]|uniref:Uncharacterized protein n=1 Tax=Apiotrichum porosum TaxID=105984 RepID=A0A427XWU2_9TREE|nr:uncharacterized protein EHS24_006978 [Apiotrichum porosum]RSH83303.1 hypothetical protein EHS24_006978 [Apiotrichum porosum]